MTHLRHTLEAHPLLGYIGSFVAFVMSGLAWLIDHASTIAGAVAPVFGCGAAIFGFMAGYYTFRIQRRAWKRGERRR